MKKLIEDNTEAKPLKIKPNNTNSRDNLDKLIE